MALHNLVILLGLFLQATPFQAKVIGIADGHTITVFRDLEEIRIRLEGIDCSEDGAEFAAKAERFAVGSSARMAL